MAGIGRLMLLATLALPATAWAAGDVVRGKREFLPCAICHSAQAHVHKEGPGLATVYGRAAGTVEGYARHSDALRQAGIVWTDETLDTWLEEPVALVPGTNMKIPGIKNAGVRRDIIAYLKDLARQNETTTSTTGNAKP